FCSCCRTGPASLFYYPLSLHDALPISLFLQDGLPLMAEWIGFPTLYYQPVPQSISEIQFIRGGSSLLYGPEPAPAVNKLNLADADRKSTRLNSSHRTISYAVFCLKKKK